MVVLVDFGDVGVEGYAAHFFSGKKRGITVQIISLLITLIAILVIEVFVFTHFVVVTIQQEQGYVGNELDFLSELFSGYVDQGFFVEEFFKNLISPIGLLIYGIALYTAFTTPAPQAKSEQSEESKK